MNLGEEFAIGLPTPRTPVNNWPDTGERVQLQWEQAIQNWTIVSADDFNATGEWDLNVTLTTPLVSALTKAEPCPIPAEFGPFLDGAGMGLRIAQTEGGNDFSGKFMASQTTAVLGGAGATGAIQFVLDTTGSVQPDGAFIFTTTPLTIPGDALIPGCVLSVTANGSGNFPQRSVSEVTIEIGTSAACDTDTGAAVSCEVAFSGDITLTPFP